MLTLGHDCPHCLRERIAFTAHGQSVRNPQDSRLWSTLFTCNGCFGPLLVVAASAAGGVSPTSHSGALENMSGYKIASAYPPGPMIEVPEHLPDAVDQAFREGCMNVKRAPSLACVGFRRALETGLKALSPDIDAWRLERRIDRMTEQGLLTKDLSDWAHQLRLDGNGAAHEAGGETVEHAEQMQELTRYVLTYVFTLPEKIKIKRKA